MTESLQLAEPATLPQERRHSEGAPGEISKALPRLAVVVFEL